MTRMTGRKVGVTVTVTVDRLGSETKTQLKTGLESVPVSDERKAPQCVQLGTR